MQNSLVFIIAPLFVFPAKAHYCPRRFRITKKVTYLVVPARGEGLLRGSPIVTLGLDPRASRSHYRPSPCRPSVQARGFHKFALESLLLLEEALGSSPRVTMGSHATKQRGDDKFWGFEFIFICQKRVRILHVILLFSLFLKNVLDSSAPTQGRQLGAILCTQRFVFLGLTQNPLTP